MNEVLTCFSCAGNKLEKQLGFYVDSKWQASTILLRKACRPGAHHAAQKPGAS